MTRIIRLIMLIEATSFAIAAFTHFGMLFNGYYSHQRAGIAESVIATVLVVGLFVSVTRGARTLGVELGTQLFALFGTLVGIFTIIVGVGPRTVPDIVYHITIVIVLALGLSLTLWARSRLV